MNPHPRRLSGMDLAFALLGSLVVLFILAPLLSALFSSSPASLWQALQDGEVLASIRITCLAGLLAVLLGPCGNGMTWSSWDLAAGCPQPGAWQCPSRAMTNSRNASGR